MTRRTGTRESSNARTPKRLFAVVLLLYAAASTALLVGCDGKTSAEKLREAGFDPASRAVSFDAIADQLNNLDQAVKARNEARVPTDVIVDATRSTDQQPVLAVITDGPSRSGVFAYLHVPQGNVDFVARGVAPGDVVEYFVEVPDPADPTTTKRRSVQLFVAKVVDPHTLLIDPPLPPLDDGESYPPFPIVVSRLDRSREERVERAFSTWQLTGEPVVGWEMTPDRDAIGQLVLQLNQWTQRDDTAFAWQADPMIAALPNERREHFGDLAAERFVEEEGRLLQEAVWLRDVARRASVSADPLEQARILFDWTVRNLQLESDDTLQGIRQRPWQNLASGRATAEERAWVFMLLLRQANIDAVALTVPLGTADDAGDGNAGNQSAAANGRVLWAVAAKIGEDWRLFDPALGLPLPGPDGSGVATLAEVKADDALLRRLDLGDDERYPFTASQAGRATALIEATPLYVSRRARRIELQLAGANRIVLSTSPTRIAEAIRPYVAAVDIWSIDADTRAAQENLSTAARSQLVELYRTYARVAALWKGRVLQFKDDDHRLELDFADRPVRVYVRQRDPRWYFTQYCRPSDKDLSTADPTRYTKNDVDSLRLTKHLATVWMGEVNYEDADYREAAAYFGERTLDRDGDAVLANLARFALAQTHERTAELLDRVAGAVGEPADGDSADGESADGESADGESAVGDSQWLTSSKRALRHALRSAADEQRRAAVALYEGDRSPQQHGSRLRARRLQKVLASRDGGLAAVATPAEADADATAPSAPAAPEP